METVDFVIVTALEEEFDAVKSKIPDCQKLPPLEEDIHVYFRGTIPITDSPEKYQVVLLSLLGMGHEEATSATKDAIRTWRPRYVILVGIAGGIKSQKVKLGDILVSNRIANYNLEKVSEEKTEIRWKAHDVDQRLLAHAQHLKGESIAALILTKRPRKGQLDRHVGPIASGNKVIAKEEALKVYQKTWPKLKGVEMEGGGVAIATIQSANPTGFFMIRAVSDHADDKKSSSTVQKWRKYACDAAATYTIELLKSGPILISITNELFSATQQTPTVDTLQAKGNDKEILDNLIVDINFEEQIAEASTLIKENNIISFLIHGQPGCRQDVLAQRLLKFSPIVSQCEPEKFKVTISNITGKQKSFFWKEVSRAFEMTDGSRYSSIPQDICNRWKSRNVIIVIDDIGFAQDNIFKEIVEEFWKPIVNEAQSRLSSQPEAYNRCYKIILFLLDSSISKRAFNEALVCNASSENIDIRLPICLSPIGEFSETSIKKWAQDAADQGLSAVYDLEVADIMSRSRNGIAEFVYKQIYKSCGQPYTMAKLGI